MKKTTIIVTAALCLTCVAVSAETQKPVAEGPLDDYAFLVKHMPEKDRGVVSEEYLRKNVALAQEARRTAPWRDTITDEIFREYVLPYSSIGEEVDDWRPLFREKFWPLVKNCKTTGEAVQLINSKIWKTLNVRYNTKRDKPDQSPFHSMRIHMASCTGLAILEIDVYRACGIPARFTGCNWTPIPGNHSWVEYYDNGKWHFFNDAEDDKLAKPDESWFASYAAQADETSPRTRIYAARWSANGTWFWCTWRGGNAPSSVPAEAGGVFIPSVPHWSDVKAGEKIGDVVNPLSGDILWEARSPVTGRIFTLREYPVVNPGSLLARILEMN